MTTPLKLKNLPDRIGSSTRVFLSQPSPPGKLNEHKKQLGASSHATMAATAWLLPAKPPLCHRLSSNQNCCGPHHHGVADALTGMRRHHNNTSKEVNGTIVLPAGPTWF